MYILYFDHFDHYDHFLVSVTHVSVDFVERIALQIKPSIATESISSNVFVFIITF